MDLGIKGKRAMVAAGTKGIGLACATELAKEGCRVSICARDEAKFAVAAEHIRSEAPDADLHFQVCDVTSRNDLQAWVDEVNQSWGGVDILVTNTGGPPAGHWTEMNDDHWQSGFESTVLNVTRMVEMVAPTMKAQGWGRIIHITSVVAKEPSALLPISSTLRSGLMSLTLLQSKELAPYGVTVNGVLPGHTMTDRQVHLAEVVSARDEISVEEALTQRGQTLPVGRLGQADEIGAAVAFLASKRASFISGINLLVDGGQVNCPS
ncbi:MAG: SDR family oxidoreductase [Armatimonadetes bacterium]|nr:SDR family oxidoreductase [Armatimonadota bacterium]